MFEAGIGDSSAGEVQLLEPGQSFEVFQPGVADLGAAEAEHLEPGQSLEAFEGGVVEVGARQVQPLEFGQVFEAFQRRISQLGRLDHHADHGLVRAAFVHDDFAARLPDLGNCAFLPGIGCGRPTPASRCEQQS